jgi:hypothetical protein
MLSSRFGQALHQAKKAGDRITTVFIESLRGRVMLAFASLMKDVWRCDGQIPLARWKIILRMRYCFMVPRTYDFEVGGSTISVNFHLQPALCSYHQHEVAKGGRESNDRSN